LRVFGLDGSPARDYAASASRYARADY